MINQDLINLIKMSHLITALINTLIVINRD